MFDAVDFSALALPAQAETLRAEVRAFLREEVKAGRIVAHLGHTEYDKEFTRKVAARGWIGMTWPKRYGGHERSYLERFVVTEEMLAVAAPCAAHWFGDRQTGPSLLRYGTEAQRAKFLPAIARGEMVFALGMSEPDAGSDLAAVRTKATRVDGGWSVTGQKVWTSWAHKADAFFVLCRTGAEDGDRHNGLSQLIVEFNSPGVTVRPIRFMNGHHQFNQIYLDNVFVPDAMAVAAQSKDTDHILTRKIEEVTGVNVTYIPFKSGGEAAVQLAGGHLDSNTNNPGENASYWKAGKVRPLCVFSSTALSGSDKVSKDMSWSDIPLCKDNGIAINAFNMPRTVWMAGGVKPEETAYYVDLLKKVAEKPEWKAWLARGVQSEFFQEGAQLNAYIKKDVSEHRDLFDKNGWLVKN